MYVMEYLIKLHNIISEHNEDFTTLELMDIAECIWAISLELKNNKSDTD